MTVREDRKTSKVALVEDLARGRARFEWGRVCYTLVRFDRAGQLRECAVRKCVDWGLRYESL